jgi:hypothetical protein
MRLEKLRNRELHDLHSSPDINRMVISSIMGLVLHVARNIRAGNMEFW